jgi:hypothetical protein
LITCLERFFALSLVKRLMLPHIDPFGIDEDSLR